MAWDSRLLPGLILGFIEGDLLNVTQKADFMRKKKDALPELSITSSKGAAVVLIRVWEREEPQSGFKRSHVDFAPSSWNQRLSSPSCASGQGIFWLSK